MYRHLVCYFQVVYMHSVGFSNHPYFLCIGHTCFLLCAVVFSLKVSATKIVICAGTKFFSCTNNIIDLPSAVSNVDSTLTRATQTPSEGRSVRVLVTYST